MASAEDPMLSAYLKECHPTVSITLRHFSHNYHGTRTAAAAVCLYVSLPRRSNTHTHTHNSLSVDHFHVFLRASQRLKDTAIRIKLIRRRQRNTCRRATSSPAADTTPVPIRPRLE